MIKGLKIRNLEIIKRLDKMAEAVYKVPATYNQAPLPDVTLAKLRTKMKANDGVYDETNSVDYSNRSVTGEIKYSRDAFLTSVRRYTGSQQWYWDSYEAQVPYWGWTSWHNNKDKPRKFIRFIHNSGDGHTRYVADKVYKKVPDQHSVYNSDWTVLVGTMEGDEWLSDRNRAGKPRVVFDLSIPTEYTKEWEKMISLINSV